MKKILSIIIPSFNMEKYLENCLNSLLIPSIEMLEVIIVNDGSTDKTSSIAHRYENKFSTVFKVIDKKNGNYGSCINAALPLITGKYVKILDADDSFNTKELESFIKELISLDIDCIITDYCIVNQSGKITKEIKYNKITPYKKLQLKDILLFVVDKISMHAITYRTELLKEINYKQTEGISYTDMEWVFEPFAVSKNYIRIPKTVYKYLIGREGQTIEIGKRIKNYDQFEKIYLKQINYIDKKRNILKGDQYEFLRRRLIINLYDFYYIGMTNNIISEQLRQFHHLNSATLNQNNINPDNYFASFDFFHKWIQDKIKNKNVNKFYNFYFRFLRKFKLYKIEKFLKKPVK